MQRRHQQQLYSSAVVECDACHCCCSVGAYAGDLAQLCVPTRAAAMQQQQAGTQETGWDALFRPVLGSRTTSYSATAGATKLRRQQQPGL
jgi:hypothetical protein